MAADTPREAIPIAQRSTPVRLAYLDGLRGVAALYVVANHIHTDVDRHNVLSPSIKWLTSPLQLGHFAVAIFIVLSGYSLMLPIARSANGELAGGMKGFLLRRARRILPPYYAALILTLLCALVLPTMRLRSDTCWAESSLPLFSPGILISHFLLVHNLNGDWVIKISVPFWSIATEWQIYFFFPLILLPVWRRFGNSAALGAAFFIGLGLWFGLKPQLEQARPFYLALFGCGMFVAALNFPSESDRPLQTHRIPWGPLIFLFGTAMVCIMKFRPNTVWPDVLVGFTTAAFLAYCTNGILRGSADQRPWIVRLLEKGPLLFLGSFSYSLYLVHFQILALVHLALNRAGYSARTEAVLLPLLTLPICLVGAYCFYLILERPFIRTARPAAPDRFSI